jgi:NADH-quinone oxidoreductase subunit E
MIELTEKQVLSIMEEYDKDPQQLIAVLLDIQDNSGRNYVEKRWAELVSKELKVPLTKIYEIITFYSMFSTSPRGRHIIEVCQSAPCKFTGASNLVSWFQELLGISVGNTTEDGLFTLQRTSCVGACDGSPSVKIGSLVYGNLSFEKVKDILQSYRNDSKIEGHNFSKESKSF